MRPDTPQGAGRARRFFPASGFFTAPSTKAKVSSRSMSSVR